MAYTDIRKEICPLVYEQVLALANPETGVALVKAPDIRAMIGCGKYEDRHMLKALEYLVADGKLEYVSYNGVAGAKYRVPDLCKGNTVVKTIDPEKPRQKLEEPTPTQAWPKNPAKPKTLEEMFPKIEKPASPKQEEIFKALTLADALDDAERVLSECPELIGKVFSQFLKMRTALTNLVDEVKKDD